MDDEEERVDDDDPYAQSLRAARAQQLAIMPISAHGATATPLSPSGVASESTSALKSGSLLALLGWIVENGAGTEAEVIFLSHEHWRIPATDVFNGLLELYNFGCPWRYSKPTPQFHRNVMFALSKWVACCFQSDFFSTEEGAVLRTRVQEFVRSVQLSRDGLSVEAQQAQLQFLRSEMEMEEFMVSTSTMLERQAAAAVPHSPMKLAGRLSVRMDSRTAQHRASKLSLLAVKPQDVAQQLCRIDFGYFCKISLSEFAGLRFSRNDKKTSAPTIMNVVDRWNQVAGWVATEIVLATAKDRLNVLKRFIMIADQLLAHSNFASLLAVMAGLNLHAVSRLTAVWAQLPEKYGKAFERLSKLISSHGNYRNYRELYRRARETRSAEVAAAAATATAAAAAAPSAGSAATEAPATQAILSAGVPIVPYVGLYMRDFTFVEDGNQTLLQNGHINFEKMMLWGKLLREMREMQRQPCAIQENAELCNFLTNLTVCSEDSLYAAQQHQDGQ